MDYLLLQRRHQTRDQGREVWLFAIYAPDGTGPVLTITDNPGDIVYDGDTYTAYNCGFREPPEMASDDSLPVAVLRISNVLRSLQDDIGASDWYRGGTIVIVPYNTAEPAADYGTETKILDIVSHQSTLQDIEFTLSLPGEVTDPVPEDEYSPYGCRHLFRGLRCGYAGQTIVDVGLAEGDPVSVRVTGHGFATGAVIQLESVGGITPALAGIYTITLWPSNPADVFLLDDTNGGDYAGSYTSGGLAGYAYCEQHLTDCRARGRQASFGACPGLHVEGVRVAV